MLTRLIVVLLFSCCVAGRPFSSRAASRSRLVVASRWRIVIGDLPVAVALHACGSPGLRLVSRLVERGGFGFSYYHRREWIGDGSRLAVSGPVLACLCAVGVGRCRSHHRSSRLLPIVLWLRGVGPCGVPHFAHRCLLLVPGGYRSCLVPLIRFEAGGTEGWTAAACLDIVMWLIVSRRLMYIMNMIYAMYIKDTRIQ